VSWEAGRTARIAASNDDHTREYAIASRRE
jgi:hypothetical protein